MHEPLKTIISLFHEISSTLGVCREDLQVMIEQHQRNTLLVDRIQESARRLNHVIESMPHMADLLDAISRDAEPAFGGRLPLTEAEPEPEDVSGESPEGDEGLVEDPLEDPEPEPETEAEPEPEPPPEDEVG